MHSFKVPLLMLATVILLTGCSDPKTAASSAPALRASGVEPSGRTSSSGTPASGR